MKIKNITDKQLWFNSTYSSFYKVKIDDVNLILKETFEPAWSASKIIRSYENCMKLYNTDMIVKVYDYALIDGKAVVLMEDLDEYQNLLKVIVPSTGYKDRILKQILDLYNNMLSLRLINYDFTIINFMVKDEKIKMIDLEFIDDINKMELFRVLWFCERIDVIQQWHGNSYDTFMKIKEDVLLKWHQTVT